MRSRLLILLLALVAACCATAAPAAAVETGVNETLAQTVPSAERAPELGADWVRVWALWQDLEQSQGVYTEHLIVDLERAGGGVEGAGDQGAGGGASGAGVGDGAAQSDRAAGECADVRGVHADVGAAVAGGGCVGVVE